jgi:hypothetical protein
MKKQSSVGSFIVPYAVCIGVGFLAGARWVEERSLPSRYKDMYIEKQSDSILRIKGELLDFSRRERNLALARPILSPPRSDVPVGFPASALRDAPSWPRPTASLAMLTPNREPASVDNVHIATPPPPAATLAAWPMSPVSLTTQAMPVLRAAPGDVHSSQQDVTGGNAATLTGGDNVKFTAGNASKLSGGSHAILTAGDRSILTGGDQATLKAGNESTLKGGKRSVLTAGDASSLSGGDNATLKAGNGSTLKGGDRSLLTAGDGSTLVGGNRATLRAYNGSTLVGGSGAILTAGDGSTLTACEGAILTAGTGSTLIIRRWDGKQWQTHDYHVGQDGIEANVTYRIEAGNLALRPTRRDHLWTLRTKTKRYGTDYMAVD